VVDEVLAVGDAEFQKKAIGKMQDVSRGEGRTVLFVSHNMASIQQLCNKAVIFDNGSILDRGETNVMIQKYLSHNSNSIGERDVIVKLSGVKRDGGLGEIVKFSKCAMHNASGILSNSFLYGEPFSVLFEIDAMYPDKDFNVVIGISTLTGQRIATGVSTDNRMQFSSGAGRKLYGKFSAHSLPLHPGVYTLHLGIRPFDEIKDAYRFEIKNMSYANFPEYMNLWGFVNLHGTWNQLDRGIEND
jgi:lipopolysaccharide transport system ATP-binding protein